MKNPKPVLFSALFLSLLVATNVLADNSSPAANGSNTSGYSIHPRVDFTPGAVETRKQELELKAGSASSSAAGPGATFQGEARVPLHLWGSQKQDANGSTIHGLLLDPGAKVRLDTAQGQVNRLQIDATGAALHRWQGTTDHATSQGLAARDQNLAALQKRADGLRPQIQALVAKSEKELAAIAEVAQAPAWTPEQLAEYKATKERLVKKVREEILPKLKNSSSGETVREATKLVNEDPYLLDSLLYGSTPQAVTDFVRQLPYLHTSSFPREIEEFILTKDQVEMRKYEDAKDRLTRERYETVRKYHADVTKLLDSNPEFTKALSGKTWDGQGSIISRALADASKIPSAEETLASIKSQMSVELPAGPPYTESSATGQLTIGHAGYRYADIRDSGVRQNVAVITPVDMSGAAAFRIARNVNVGVCAALKPLQGLAGKSEGSGKLLTSAQHCLDVTVGQMPTVRNTVGLSYAFDDGDYKKGEANNARLVFSNELTMSKKLGPVTPTVGWTHEKDCVGGVDKCVNRNMFTAGAAF